MQDFRFQRRHADQGIINPDFGAGRDAGKPEIGPARLQDKFRRLQSAEPLDFKRQSGRKVTFGHDAQPMPAPVDFGGACRVNGQLLLAREQAKWHRGCHGDADAPGQFLQLEDKFLEAVTRDDNRLLQRPVALTQRPDGITARQHHLPLADGDGRRETLQ